MRLGCTRAAQLRVIAASASRKSSSKERAHYMHVLRGACHSHVKASSHVRDSFMSARESSVGHASQAGGVIGGSRFIQLCGRSWMIIVGSDGNASRV
eukprot:6492458-Amphidinium_carterae.4